MAQSVSSVGFKEAFVAAGGVRFIGIALAAGGFLAEYHCSGLNKPGDHNALTNPVTITEPAKEQPSVPARPFE